MNEYYYTTTKNIVLELPKMANTHRLNLVEVYS